MVFHLPGLKLSLLVVAMGAMVLSAGAQSSDRSIIFSTPKSDDTPAATPSLSPQNSQLPVLPDSLQAPDPVFRYSSPDALPAEPPARTATPRSQQMEKMLEDRKNWTLLTPEEIMGITRRISCSNHPIAMHWDAKRTRRHWNACWTAKARRTAV